MLASTRENQEWSWKYGAWKLSALVMLLALPLSGAFYFSNEKRWLWLMTSASALLMLVAMVLLLLGRIGSATVRKSLAVLVFNAIVLFQLLRLVSFYLQGESFNERFFFHFSLSTLTEAGPAYLPLLLLSLVLLTGVSVLSWRLARLPLLPRPMPVPGLSVSVILLGVMVVALEPELRLRLREYVQAQRLPAPTSLEQVDWRRLHLHQAALRPGPGSAEPGRNLVLIYLESLEDIYTDEALFPGLTPYLNQLKAESLFFSNMIQVDGAGWTVGGIVSSQCGTPLLTDFLVGGNDILHQGFLEQAVCLGDVLGAAGYRQVYMGGASTQFAGKGRFLAAHGYDSVMGREQLMPLLTDQSYQTGWGLYDDSLYSLALEQFDALAAADVPFNLTLLTLDTHHPDGEASASCAPYAGIDNSMLHAVHCADQLLENFIGELSRHPAWQETTVAIVTDHLAMRNAAQPLYPQGYRRRPLFLVLNAGRQAHEPVPATHSDVAPTLLSLLGVGHDREFLAGRDLLSGQDDPDTLLRAIYSPLRDSTLRYLNSSWLTASVDRVCEYQVLVESNGESLLVGGRQVTLSLFGEPVAMSDIGVTHAVVALLGPRGRVRLSQAVPLENLPHVLYEYRDLVVLLITRAEALPPFIDVESPQDAALAVLVGNIASGWHSVGGGQSLEDFSIGFDDCDAVLGQLVSSIGDREPLEELAAVCADLSGAAPFRFDEVSGTLHLSRVAFENNWYQGEMVFQGLGRFEVSRMEPVSPPSDEESFCHAYVGNSELVIPLVETGNGMQAMTMRILPGTAMAFDLLERRWIEG